MKEAQGQEGWFTPLTKQFLTEQSHPSSYFAAAAGAAGAASAYS